MDAVASQQYFKIVAQASRAVTARGQVRYEITGGSRMIPLRCQRGGALRIAVTP